MATGTADDAAQPAERVAVSSPDKVLFDGEPPVTKADLVRHYERVGELLLAHARGRPVTLQAFPAGIGRPGHFIKQIPSHFPAWVDRVTVPKRGGTVTHVLAERPETLRLLANQNTITPHVWTSRVPDLERPDRLVVDLDPSAGDEDFGRIRRAARMVGELFRAVGLEPFATTTGSRGIHVVAPLAGDLGFPEVFQVAKGLAEEAVRRAPEDLTLEFLKDNREQRIFVDVLRNRWAQTVPAPYAVRARPGAPVATPLRWDELGSSRLAPDRWTLRTIGRRVGRVGDPWAGIDAAAVSARDVARRLGR
jgi:bifunctional non-homologous end joining protein LigD